MTDQDPTGGPVGSAGLVGPVGPVQLDPLKRFHLHLVAAVLHVLIDFCI